MKNNELDQDSAADQAAYWLVRLSSADCAPAERFAFEAWKLEDPANESAFLQVQKGSAMVDRHMDDPRIQAMLSDARKAVRFAGATPVAVSSRRRRRGLLVAATAVVCILVLGVTLNLTYLVNSYGSPDPRPPAHAATLEKFTLYDTKVGERSSVTLADGTMVALNTNSRLEVAYTASRRSVRLSHGQAYFSVAKELDRPFIVEAGDRQVIALGTAFDVRLDQPDVVQVTLVEGRVQVNGRAPESMQGTDPAHLMVEHAAVELNPGERLIAGRNRTPDVNPTDAVEETSWRRGQLVFRSRPLAHVVAEMNRYSDQQMVLGDDPRTRAIIVSGVFKAGGGASSFTKALESLYPVQAIRSGANELSLRFRE